MVETQQSRFVINSKPTHSNASGNAYERVLDFLESQPSSDEFWCPKRISDELGMIPSTVRGALRELLKINKVMVFPKGKIHLYGSTKRFSDEFTRLMKMHPPIERPQIHGLTLKLEAQSIQQLDFSNALPVGGSIVREQGWVGSGGRGTGETSFQLSRGTLMVYGGFSLEPLDFDGWLLWLKQVDGYLCAKKWPRLLGGNFVFWVACQLGLNYDDSKVRCDSFTEAISVQTFDEWFARCYKKRLGNGETIVRSEVHVNAEKSLEKMIQTISGSMHSVMVDNKVDGAAEAVNNNTATLQEQKRKLVDIEKKIDLLKNNGVGLPPSRDIDGSIYSLEFKLDSLRHDFFEFKQNYEGKTQRLIDTNEGLSGLLKEMMTMMKGSVESQSVPSNDKKLGENVDEYVR